MIPIIGLLFILGALPGFPTQRIHVSQDPEIRASEGDSVTLPCTYSINTRENPTIGNYMWYRHEVRAGPSVSNKNKDFHGRVSIENRDSFIRDKAAPLELHQLVQSDTGLYYCEVTLQLYGEISGHGNGTFLNVTAKKMPPYAVLNIVKLILLILGLLAAIALYCYIKGFSMRRRHDDCSSYNNQPSLPTKKMPPYAVLNIVKLILLILGLLAAIALYCYIKGFSMRRRHDDCSSYNNQPSLPSKAVSSPGNSGGAP